MANISGSFRDLTAQCGEPTSVNALSSAVTSSSGSVLAETKIHTQSGMINPMEMQPLAHQAIVQQPPLFGNPPAPTTAMMIQQSQMATLQQQQAQMMMEKMFEEFQGKLQLSNKGNNVNTVTSNNNNTSTNESIIPTNQMVVQHQQPYGSLPMGRMYGQMQMPMPTYGPMMMHSHTFPFMHPAHYNQPYQIPNVIQNQNKEDSFITTQPDGKEDETISTNGTQDLKDDETVRNELDDLDPSEKDLDTIQRLLQNTEDQNMQNSQFFHLLRDLANKRATSHSMAADDEQKDISEQIAKEWEQDFQRWNNPVDGMDWKSYMDAINPLKTATAETYEFQTANPYLKDKGDEEETVTTESTEKEDTSKESTKQQIEKDFDYMAEGLRLMKEGNLSEAILAFEACVQKEPNRSEAWRHLGQCQADNENEKPAIAAYLKCYELDPYDLDALLALGVSYTNEIDFFEALKFLREWIASHPEYSVLAQDASQKTNNDDYFGGWGGSTAEHKKVVELFHKALEINANDPDLHTVLGVLYNITNEYDFAERHFKRALQARPDDPSLWNKLGATQANGQKCQIAINAYSKALELKPNYVRALSNLGISFANQKMHTEACQSYLASLKLNPHAMPIWDHLRTSLMHLGRNDLIQLIEKRDVSLFAKHFDF